LIKQYNQSCELVWKTILDLNRVNDIEFFLSFPVSIQELLKLTAEIRIHSIYKSYHPQKRIEIVEHLNEYLLKKKQDLTDTEILLKSTLHGITSRVVPVYSSDSLAHGYLSQEHGNTAEDIIGVSPQHVTFSIQPDGNKKIVVTYDECRKYIDNLMEAELTFINVVTEELLKNGSHNQTPRTPRNSRSLPTTMFTNNLFNLHISTYSSEEDIIQPLELEDHMYRRQLTDSQSTTDIRRSVQLVGTSFNQLSMPPSMDDIASGIKKKSQRYSLVRPLNRNQYNDKIGRLDSNMLYLEGRSNSQLDGYYVNYFGTLLQYDINGQTPLPIITEQSNNLVDRNTLFPNIQFLSEQELRNTLMNSVKENLTIVPQSPMSQDSMFEKFTFYVRENDMLSCTRMFKSAYEFLKLQVIQGYNVLCDSNRRFHLQQDDDGDFVGTEFFTSNLLEIQSIPKLFAVMRNISGPIIPQYFEFTSESGTAIHLLSFLTNWLNTKIHELMVRPKLKDMCVIHHEVTVLLHILHNLMLQQDKLNSMLLKQQQQYSPDIVSTVKSDIVSVELSSLYNKLQILLGKITDLLYSETSDMCTQYFVKMFSDTGGSFGQFYITRNSKRKTGRWFRKVGISSSLVSNKSLLESAVDEIAVPAFQVLFELNSITRTNLSSLFVSRLIESYLKFFKSQHLEQIRDIEEKQRKSIKSQTRLKKIELLDMRNQMESDFQNICRWIKQSDTIDKQEQIVILENTSIKRLSSIVQILQQETVEVSLNKYASADSSVSEGKKMEPLQKSSPKQQQLPSKSFSIRKKNIIVPTNSSNDNSPENTSSRLFANANFIRSSDERFFC
jgi:hypothetical protein